MIAEIDFHGVALVIAAIGSAYAAIIGARNARKVDVVAVKIEETAALLDATHNAVNGQGEALRKLAYAAGGRDKVAEQHGAPQEGVPDVTQPVQAPESAPNRPERGGSAPGAT